MTNKLPEWPKAQPTAGWVHDVNNDIIYLLAVIAFWESRCRLAVGAMKEHVEQHGMEHEGIGIALETIGPLPPKDQP